MRRSAAVLAAVFGLVTPALLLQGSSAPSPSDDRPAARVPLHDPLASVPIGFTPNHGQAPEGVEFVSRGPGFSLFLTRSEAVLSLGRAGTDRGLLRMRPVGANPHPELHGERQLPGHTTHLAPGRALAALPSFGAVRYRSLYPGVDLVFYGTQRRLEHDFVVSPGADPSQVTVELEGAEDMVVGPGGGLFLRAGDQPVRLERPYLFQEFAGERRPVAGEFRVTGDRTVGFRVGAYDRRLPLVIDPVLVTSSYLGGKGAEKATAVAVDAAGSIYVGGATDSADFPVAGPSPSSLNQSQPGATDAFVTKIAADGRETLFSTYLGGSGADGVSALALTGDGGVVLAGDTGSADLPRGTATQGGFGGGQSDGYVAKLKPDGTGLAWSMFVGAGGEDSARALAVDAAGGAFVVGSTNSPDFASNGLQAATPRPGDDDAFVVKVNPGGTAIDYAARLGGEGVDRATAVVVDGPGNTYLTGDTTSPAFPTQQPIQDRLNPAGAEGEIFTDAFVAKLDPSGRSLIYSSYLGGSQDDHGVGIAVDSEGAAYVAGTTSSPNLPTKSPVQGKNNGESDAFVAKLTPPGDGLVYSTYFGGTGVERAGGVALDGDRNALVAGTTSSSDFETAQPLQAEAAGGASEAFLFKVDVGGVLDSSTFLGGEGADQGLGVAVTEGGTAFVVGSTDSARFPVNGAFQEQLAGGGEDSFVTRIDPQGGLPSSSAAAERHQRRLRLLLATTVVLFLVAGLQTLYLRRRPGPQVGFGVPVVVPTRGEGPPDEEEWTDDVDQERAGVPVLEHDVPIPDMVVEESGLASEAEAVDARKSSEVIDDTAFWALFPSDIPPPSVPPAGAPVPPVAAGSEPPSDGIRLADLLNAELPAESDDEIDLYAQTGTHFAVMDTPDEDRFFEASGSHPVVDPEHDPRAAAPPEGRQEHEPPGDRAEEEPFAPVGAAADAPAGPVGFPDEVDPWAVWRDQPGPGPLDEDEVDEVWTAWTGHPEPEGDEELEVGFEEEGGEPEQEPEVLVTYPSAWPEPPDVAPPPVDASVEPPAPPPEHLPEIEPIFEPVPEPAPVRDVGPEVAEPAPEPDEPAAEAPSGIGAEPPPEALDEEVYAEPAPELTADAAPAPSAEPLDREMPSEPADEQERLGPTSPRDPEGEIVELLAEWPVVAADEEPGGGEADTDMVAAFGSSDVDDGVEEISIEDLLAHAPEDEPFTATRDEPPLAPPPEQPAEPPAAPWVESRPAPAYAEPVEVPPEVPVEAPPEVPVEAPPEVPVEVPPEVPVEAPPEAPPEVPVEVPPEVSPQPPPEPVEVPPEPVEVPPEPVEVPPEPVEVERPPATSRQAGGAPEKRVESEDPGLGALLADAARWLRSRRRP